MTSRDDDRRYRARGRAYRSRRFRSCSGSPLVKAETTRAGRSRDRELGYVYNRGAANLRRGPLQHRRHGHQRPDESVLRRARRRHRARPAGLGITFRSSPTRVRTRPARRRCSGPCASTARPASSCAGASGPMPTPCRRSSWDPGGSRHAPRARCRGVRRRARQSCGGARARSTSSARHRRLAFLGGFSRMSAFTGTLAGFKDALGRAGA